MTYTKYVASPHFKYFCSVVVTYSTSASLCITKCVTATRTQTFLHKLHAYGNKGNGNSAETKGTERYPCYSVHSFLTAFFFFCALVFWNLFGARVHFTNVWNWLFWLRYLLLLLPFDVSRCFSWSGMLKLPSSLPSVQITFFPFRALSIFISLPLLNFPLCMLNAFHAIPHSHHTVHV